jgi:hypothetical protein
VLAAAAVVITWPLSAQITRSLPGDYGDPVFVSWVIAWVDGQLARATLDGFWTANIFFPERNTLAFSEHFIAQSLMVAPIYWLSGNPILSYNAAFLLTFVLTGLGTFFLTRALTGSDAAGFVAALMAAFNQYRLVYEVAHLHTLSIHWFPFALFLLHRYFETDRRGFLAGAGVALVALNLSSIYYMAYCTPFVIVFVVFEMVRFGRLTTLRVWLELWATAAFVLAVTAPFLLPYIDVQRRLGVARAVDEIVRYSAMLDHYRIALPALAPAAVLALVAAGAAAVDRSLRWTVTMAVVLLAFAFWLSLGPVPQSGGQPLGWPGLYGVLHAYVPGFSGLRVPARFAMLFFIFLAMLAGAGVAALERQWLLIGRAIGAAALIAFLLAARPPTFPLNVALGSESLVNPPPAYLTPAAHLPAIYRVVESLRDGAILAELPFGDPWYDLRYQYFSGLHRRRLLNGYSGLFPPSFLTRQRVLARPLLDPHASAQALGGATHIVVHRAAWRDDTGVKIGAWLEQTGATMVADAEGAVLYELPVRQELALEVEVPAHDEARPFMRELEEARPGNPSWHVLIPIQVVVVATEAELGIAKIPVESEAPVDSDLRPKAEVIAHLSCRLVGLDDLAGRRFEARDLLRIPAETGDDVWRERRSHGKYQQRGLDWVLANLGVERSGLLGSEVHGDLEGGLAAAKPHGAAPEPPAVVRQLLRPAHERHSRSDREPLRERGGRNRQEPQEQRDGDGSHIVNYRAEECSSVAQKAKKGRRWRPATLRNVTGA